MVRGGLRAEEIARKDAMKEELDKAEEVDRIRVARRGKLAGQLGALSEEAEATKRQSRHVSFAMLRARQQAVRSSQEENAVNWHAGHKHKDHQAGYVAEKRFEYATKLINEVHVLATSDTNSSKLKRAVSRKDRFAAGSRLDLLRTGGNAAAAAWGEQRRQTALLDLVNNGLEEELGVQYGYVDDELLEVISLRLEALRDRYLHRIHDNGAALTLKHQTVRRFELRAVVWAFAANDTLERVDLSENDLDDQAVALLARGLQHVPKLNLLNLSSNVRLGLEGIKALAAALDFRGKEKTGERAVPLQELQLQGCKLGEPPMQPLLEVLQFCESLTILDLRDNELPEKIGQKIGSLLMENGNLRVLRLGSNKFGHSSAKLIGSALASNVTLTDLDLSDNSFGDAGGAFIGQGLAQNEGLTSLDLSSNWLGTATCHVLSDALSENNVLRRLVLAQNPLTGDGLERIMHEAKSNQTLQHLGLRGCNCSYVSLGNNQFNFRDPSGSYDLDLAQPLQRKFATNLVKLWHAQGPETWRDVTFNGAKFTLKKEHCWPDRMPEKGRLQLNFAAAKSVAADAGIPTHLLRLVLNQLEDQLSLEKWRKELITCLCRTGAPTAEQLGALVGCLTNEKDRAEIVLELFGNLSDPHNIADVLKHFSSFSCAEVEKAIGALANFHPINPTGTYSLMLSRAADAAVADRLLQLTIEEGYWRNSPEFANWRNATIDDRPVPNEQLERPLMLTLPKRGQLRLDYVSMVTLGRQRGPPPPPPGKKKKPKGAKVQGASTLLKKSQAIASKKRLQQSAISEGGFMRLIAEVQSHMMMGEAELDDAAKWALHPDTEGAPPGAATPSPQVAERLSDWRTKQATTALKIIRRFAALQACHSYQVVRLVQALQEYGIGSTAPAGSKVDTTLSVQVAQAFYARVVDGNSFSDVHRVLPQRDQVQLGYVLGWQNVSDLANPHGIRYRLRYGHPAEKDLMWKLCRLAMYLKDDVDNWQEVRHNGKLVTMREDRRMWQSLESVLMLDSVLEFTFVCSERARQEAAALFLQRAYRARIARRKQRAMNVGSMLALGAYTHWLTRERDVKAGARRSLRDEAEAAAAAEQERIEAEIREAELRLYRAERLVQVTNTFTEVILSRRYATKWMDKSQILKDVLKKTVSASHAAALIN